MKYLILPFFLFIITSCGDSSENNELGDIADYEDSIPELVEYELDEKRLSAVEFNNELSMTLESAVHSVDVLFSSGPNDIDINLDNAAFEMEMNLFKLKGLDVISNGQAFKDAVIGL